MSKSSKKMLKILIPAGKSFRNPKTLQHFKSEENLGKDLEVDVPDNTFYRRRILKKEVKLIKEFDKVIEQPKKVAKANPQNSQDKK